MHPLFRHNKGGQYYHRIKGLFGSSLIGYWPLSETSGTTAFDLSGNGRNGTYSNVTLNNIQSKFLKPAPLFNGDSSYVSLPTMEGVFNGDEGGYSLWFRPADGLFSEETNHYILYLRADANNYVRAIYQASTNDLRLGIINDANFEGTVMYLTVEEHWLNMTFTWSKAAGNLCIYRNGHKYVTTSPFSGAWAGNLATALISSAGGYWGWMGHLSDVMLTNRLITDNEVKMILNGKTLSLLGDSITSPGSFAGSNWATIVSIENTVPLRIIDHASAGETIITHMDAQTAEACNDYADLIFIALGTNDNNAGNMTTLQAEVEENIAELKSTNPVATIYYLNVLPCWTDETGDVEVDKSNIRTAIAAACATQGVTCWDTYSTPWITADQTADGVHPTAAGHAAIAAEVLALLS